MGTSRGCLRLRAGFLLLYLTLAAISLTHCDAERSIMRKRKSSSNKHPKKLKSVKHFGLDPSTDSSNVLPYSLSDSPFSLPPYESLAPIPLPDNGPPPLCVYPPNPPSTGVPSPTFPAQGPPSSPSGSLPTPPAPYYYSSPFLPIQSPPPGPPEIVPSPPTSIPYSPEPMINPPIVYPSPSGMSPPYFEPSPPYTIPSPSGSSPPSSFPSPTGSGFPSPPSSFPSPAGGDVPSPPSFYPSPEGGIIPSPPSFYPSPGGGGVPSPPSSYPSPGGGGVPSPTIFQPPVIYPPPTVPPPPYVAPVAALWCVAKPSVPDPIIQEAMNYACWSGADCGPIQPNGPCSLPDSVYARASYAFNSYWQVSKANGASCDFGGIAMLIAVDPSYDGCHFVHD